jgi:hypothetical protein
MTSKGHFPFSPKSVEEKSSPNKARFLLLAAASLVVPLSPFERAVNGQRG